jgi:2-oxoglutarate ferredoxin oxidoreductase subunit beta
MTDKKKKGKNSEDHPLSYLLRMERIPHIWCPGCGIGTCLNALLSALDKSDLDLQKTAVVSGIGCTARAAGYINLDSFHTTHGRALPFAAGMQIANPEMNMIVMSGDGDIAAIGGNHLIHAARRNFDMLVVCVNNFNYGMTGGQCGPTTPLTAKLTTSPYGNCDEPFNLPHLVSSSGAAFVARWTPFHIRQLTKCLGTALKRNGFRFVEIISICPVYYERRNRLGDGLARMNFFKENSKIDHKADTKDVGIGFQKEIILGNFVDRKRPTFLEAYDAQMLSELGDRYIPYQGKQWA